MNNKEVRNKIYSYNKKYRVVNYDLFISFGVGLLTGIILKKVFSGSK